VRDVDEEQTTGPPKCIVHGTGNVLLSAWKEQHLHKDWNEKTVALQYTTVSIIGLKTPKQSTNCKKDWLDHVLDSRT